MPIGIMITLVAVFACVVASVIAIPKPDGHVARNRDASRPAGYRAPAPTAADVAAAPLSAELLDKVFAASDRGDDPQTIEVEPERRTKLAIAFSAAAIAAVRRREARARYTVVLAAGLFFVSLFIPVPMVLLLLWLMGLGTLVVAAVMFAEVWRARASLRTLAHSEAPPAVVAASLRRIAGWPVSEGDPLTGWPAYE